MTRTDQEERQSLTLYFFFLAAASALLLVTATLNPELSWFNVLAGFLGFVCACGALTFLVVAIWSWKHRNDGKAL